MKKIISIILALCFILSGMCFTAFATNGRINTDTINADSGELEFSCDYIEIGKPVKASVANVENLKFRWYSNDRLIGVGNTYTPVQADKETMLRAEALDENNAIVARKCIFVSNLPVIYIETENREPIVTKGIELNSSIRIQGNAEFHDKSLLYNGEAKIKGRGNSTWYDEKKPYKIKLDSKANLFGMGKNKHWVLLANAFDQTHSRNIISSLFAQDLGLNPMSMIPVELVMNGQHSGTYTLCEHVRIDSERIDITDWDNIAEDAAKEIYKNNKNELTTDDRDALEEMMAADLSWTSSDTITYNDKSYTVSEFYSYPNISGGYLFKIDTDNSELSFKTDKGCNIVIEKPEGISVQMKETVKDRCNAFEKALFSDDFCTVYNGKKMRYTDFIDVESFVKGFLANELLMNKDFGSRSTYFSIDTDGKIVYGPVWDYDLSSGSSGATIYNENWWALETEWLARLCSDPYFLAELRNAYIKYRFSAIENLIKDGGHIDSLFEVITDSAHHDEKIWAYDSDFDYEEAAFRQWIYNRIHWLDKQFESFSSIYSSMSSYFKNKKLMATAQLNYSDKTVSINCAGVIPAMAEIYVNGQLFETIDSISSDSISVNGIESGIATFVGYDADGKVAVAGYTSADPQLSSLRIDSIPSVTEYNEGDIIDLSGLKLTAVYSDGTQKQVEPDGVVSYKKNTVGPIKYSYNKITDSIGENCYVRLSYDGKFAEYAVSVNKKENADEVSRMIDSIPASSFDESAYRSIFEAKLAYDSLSDEAKKAVRNSDVLDSAMKQIDSECDGVKHKILTCYPSDIFISSNLKNYMVFIVKGNPYSVQLSFSAGGTSTYTEASGYFISKTFVGDYTIWTLNIRARDFGVVAITRPYKSEMYNYIFDNSNYRYGNIHSVECPSWVFENEDFTVKLCKRQNINDIVIKDNNSIIGTFETTDTDAECSLNIQKPGSHKLSIEYMLGDRYLVYDTVDIYIRPYNLIPLGDVNADGLINSLDAELVLCYSVGSTDLNPNQFKTADTNKDDEVNSADALLILQYSVGMIESFE